MELNIVPNVTCVMNLAMVTTSFLLSLLDVKQQLMTGKIKLLREICSKFPVD